MLSVIIPVGRSRRFTWLLPVIIPVSPSVTGIGVVVVIGVLGCACDLSVVMVEMICYFSGKSDSTCRGDRNSTHGTDRNERNKLSAPYLGPSVNWLVLL
jgi:hypothetical protein